MFANFKFFKCQNYEFIEYQLQPKFKVGDKVRVKDTLYSVNGKVGVVEKVNSYPLDYTVKINSDGWLWYLSENELEKVEEPTYGEETISDIIEEIKDYQKKINILLNRLGMKVENK